MNNFAPSFTGGAEAILAEIAQVLRQLDIDKVKAFCDAVSSAQSVFLAGAGRSGLVIRAFAMRLMHLGIKTHLVGDILTPPAGPGDILILASGSGETGSMLAIAARARAKGAKLCLVTAQPASTLGKMADAAVVLSAPPARAGAAPSGESSQPMGSLFEQSAFLFLEAAVLELMKRGRQNSGMMFLRHANLE